MGEIDKTALPADEQSTETAPLRSYQESKEFRHLSEIYFELGRTLFQQGEYGEAAQAFRDAIRRDPQSATLQLELAQAREAQQRFDDALLAYLEAVKVDPSCAVSALKKAHKWLTRDSAKSLGTWLEGEWLLAIDDSRLEKETRAAIYDFLGRASLYRGDFDQAIKHYKRAESDSPDDLFILEGTGEALWRVGKWDEAIQTLNRAVMKADESEYSDRRASTRLKLAKVLLDAKRYTEAMPVLKEGLDLKQGFVTEFEIALGRCYLAIHKPDEALQLAEDLLTHGHADIQTQSIRAAAYYELKQYQEAADAAEAALKFEPDNLPAIRLKALALIDGRLDLDQAIRLLQAYTRRKGDDLEYHLVLAHTLRLQGRSPDEIVSALDAAVANATTVPPPSLVLEWADAYLEASRPSEAIVKLEKAQHSDPSLQSLAEYWRIYGDAQKHAGTTQSALACYERGLTIEPANPLLLDRYGQLLSDGENLLKAAEIWQRLVDVAPENGMARLKLTKALHLTDQQSLALQEAEVAVKLLPDGEFKATAYELQGDIFQALQRSVEEVAKAYYEAGRQQYDRSEFETAAGLFDKANRLDPSHHSTYWYFSDSLRCSASKTEYPYLDSQKITRATEIWNKGRGIGAPSKEFAWAYLCRGFSCESLARLSANRGPHLWEAVLAIEQMLILDTGITYGWPYLARFHRLLLHDAMSLHESERGLLLDDKSTDALAERAWALASICDPGALEAVERYGKHLATSDPLVDAVRGFVLTFLGKYDEALRSLDKSLEAAPDDIWNRSIRGRTLRMSGEKEKALEDFRLCWSQSEPGKPRGDIANRERRAWVGYQLGHYSEAADLVKTLLNDPAEDRFDLCIMLVLCYLALNQPMEADQWFTQSLSYFRNKRHALEAGQDLEWLKEERKDKSDYTEVLRAITKYQEILKSKFESVKDKIYDREAAEQELQQVLEDEKDEAGNFAWLAIQASLARLQAEGKRWDKAARTYLLLNKDSARFPEAGLALDGALDALQAEGDRNLREGVPGQALALFNEVLELAVPAVSKKLIQIPIVRHVLQGAAQWVGRLRGAKALAELMAENNKKQADLFSRLGYAHFKLHDIDRARGSLIKAIQLYREIDVSSPGEALAADCRPLLRDAADYWALHDELKAFAESETDESLKTAFVAASNSLAEYLDELYQLSEEAGSTYELQSVVTPVAVEMGKSLVPEDAGPEWSLIETYLPEMRARMNQKLGVPVPGVRIRDNTILNAEDYVILLDEIPLRAGRVRMNMHYCPASREVLRELGVPDEAIEVATFPPTGEEGCWIQTQYREIVVHNHLTLLDDPRLFMVFDIEALLHQHLADLLGIEEVENLLRSWAKTVRGESLITAALPNQTARFRFARLLRALVKERVPITAWEKILKTVEAVSLGNGELAEPTRAVRLELKHLLPGNGPDSEHLTLPTAIENRLLKWMMHENGKTVFAIPQEDRQELLAKIRALPDIVHPRTVLITESSELRPFVRKLVAVEFPGLMVLAREEVVSHEKLPQTTSDHGDAGKE